MNKQLLLLATLVATQASVQAADTNYLQQVMTCGQKAATWVPKKLQDGINATKNFVAPKPEVSYFEAFKQNLISAKDTTVGYVTSFNKPSIPTWESTKDFAVHAKDATIEAASNAYASIQENVPVYFQAAQKYAVENPGTVAAITAGSIAALVVMYKTVKYIRTNCNSDQFDQYKDSVKDFCTFKK
jgi:hypothetical protein